MRRLRSPLFIGVLFLMLSLQLQAQIQVGLRISRRLYMTYEPVVATISVTNLTGRDITLQDADGEKWFSFQIRTGDGRLVPPRDPNYQLADLTIPAGQTLKRSVDLTALYPISDFGLFRVRTAVYFADSKKYFSSDYCNIEISEGKLVWEQVVGVPQNMDGAGGSRTISLLTFRQPKNNMLYVRVADHDAGIIYTTCPIGRLLVQNEPQVMLDQSNQLHVLQLCGPKSYAYSQIGINGEWLGQTVFNEIKSRPHLVKSESGDVRVAGGSEQKDLPPGAPPIPKLSERPPGMPLK